MELNRERKEYNRSIFVLGPGEFDSLGCWKYKTGADKRGKAIAGYQFNLREMNPAWTGADYVDLCYKFASSVNSKAFALIAGERCMAIQALENKFYQNGGASDGCHNGIGGTEIIDEHNAEVFDMYAISSPASYVPDVVLPKPVIPTPIPKPKNRALWS